MYRQALERKQLCQSIWVVAGMEPAISELHTVVSTKNLLMYLLLVKELSNLYFFSVPLLGTGSVLTGVLESLVSCHFISGHNNAFKNLCYKNRLYYFSLLSCGSIANSDSFAAQPTKLSSAWEHLYL